MIHWNESRIKVNVLRSRLRWCCNWKVYDSPNTKNDSNTTWTSTTIFCV